jgi:NADH-quinone oxidoreductase subunit E
MTQELKKTLPELLSKEAIKEINKEISHYPENQKQSVVMRALTIVQDEFQFLTEDLMNAVADYLEMPAIAVYEVATFYSMYEHEPVGKNLIYVCHSISCYLKGSDAIISSLEENLGVQCGQTTADGEFTLKKAECLGACIYAPMMQINKDYHESLTHDDLPEILEKYK